MATEGNKVNCEPGHTTVVFLAEELLMMDLLCVT